MRGRPWFLRAVVPWADCRELHLEPAVGPRDGSAGGFRILLAPFDRPVSLARPGCLRVVSRRAWMATLRSALLTLCEPGHLRAAARANIDVHPHQLEPALAVVSHGARRLLLADAVGLGKTIEAGLVLAELRARSALDRVLVLAPVGLCDQWCAELSDRFGLEAVVADAVWLRALRSVLPPAVSPWSVPGVLVASIDFAKRPEVRRDVERMSWDVVVVDEAHIAAGDSERRAAAQAFAARARFVLLLTATPHSGDARTFQALCGIGALAASDPIFMFRKNREEAGLARRRRVHLLRIRPSTTEVVVRRQLHDYVRMVWTRRTGPEGRDARLAMIVLLKRSLSGMGPLRRSLATRLERLGAAPEAEGTQLSLIPDEEDDADSPPAAMLGARGLGDEHEERLLLAGLSDCAALAEAHDSKRRALVRILGRLHEPAIVFTEYRDTLETLRAAAGTDAAVLHGGMDRFERAEAVRRFTAGGARLLLATDAAGEGLNLQPCCRLVINLELPWNPIRLEQRIGRVDRIGQRCTVHAVNLLAAGTAESEVLARLAARLDLARRGVGQVDDVLGLNDEAVVAACLGLDRQAGVFAARREPAGGDAVARSVHRLDLTDASRQAAARMERQRQLFRAWRDRRQADSPPARRRPGGGAAVAAVRSSRCPFTDGRTGLMALFRVRSASPAGLASSEELVPVFAEGPCPRMRSRQDVRSRGSAALSVLVPRMAALIPPRTPPSCPFPEQRDRDARLAARCRARPVFQPGLFDRRALRKAEDAEAGAVETCARLAESFDAGDAAEAGSAPTPHPELLLFVTS